MSVKREKSEATEKCSKNKGPVTLLEERTEATQIPHSLYVDGRIAVDSLRASMFADEIELDDAYEASEK